MSREDLHWLALRLFRGLGTAELPAVRARGLSLWGYEVLTRLCEGPVESQVDLAEEFGLDKSKVVRVVDELEAAGYAERVPDPDDRRRRTLSATRAGRAARKATKGELDRVERGLLARLPARDREVVLRGLRQLVDALDED